MDEGFSNTMTLVPQPHCAQDKVPQKHTFLIVFKYQRAVAAPAPEFFFWQDICQGENAKCAPFELKMCLNMRC